MQSKFKGLLAKHESSEIEETFKPFMKEEKIQKQGVSICMSNY